jgi:hypothetical protein
VHGRVNHIPNPKPSLTGAAYAQNANVTGLMEADAASPTGACVRLHTPTTTDSYSSIKAGSSIDQFSFTAMPGQTWTLVGLVKANAAAVAAGKGKLSLWYHDGKTGYIVVRSVQTLTADVYTFQSVTVTLPDTAGSFFARLYNEGASGSGAEVRFAKLRLYRGELADLPDYDFDGDDAGCDWSGVANQSASIAWDNPELYDPYADGAALTAGVATDLPEGGVSFASVAPVWTPPVLSDEELAALAWPSSQKALVGAVGGDVATVKAEWHGTTLDDRRGAFALVRAGSVLEALVGERIQVSRRGKSVVVVVVDSTDDMDEDLSLTRRAWLELANPSDESADVRVQVVTSAPAA